MADPNQLYQVPGMGDFISGAEDCKNYLVCEQDELEDADYQKFPATMFMVTSLFLFMKSLVPATKGWYVPLPFGVHVWWTDMLLILLAVMAVITRSFGYFLDISRKTRKLYLTPLLLLGFLQMISTIWNGQNVQEKGYSLLQSLLMCSTVLSAVLLVSGLSYVNRTRFTSRIIYILTFVLLVYMGLSFVFPSLRPSSEWKEWTVLGLGFIRVFGPLGNAASLSTILLPALGFSVGQLFIPGRSRFFWASVSLIIFLSIFGTGSRGGILCVGIFGVLLLMVFRITRALKFLLPAAFVLGIMLLFTGVPERFKDFTDSSRMESYKTAFRAFSSSPRNMAVGVGHGGLHNTLYSNTMRGLYGETRWFLSERESEFGFSLAGAHSTLMEVLSENGLLGTVLLATPLFWMLHILFGRSYRKLRDPWSMQAKFTLTGCAASMALMIVNTFFFSVFWLVFIWSVLAVSSIETMIENRLYAQADYGGVTEYNTIG